MTAQIHFRRRRKPSKVPLGRIDWLHEGRFGEIHLARHLLHDLIGRKFVDNKNGRWIACEGPPSESVNLMEYEWHSKGKSGLQ